MKQLNGPGATVGICAVLLAAICAECIPAMFAFIALAIGGALWDIGHGNWVGNKKSPRRAGTQSRRNQKISYIL